MDERAAIEAVTGVWCAVLDVDSVAPDTNFFEAGGQSILVLAVHEQLERLAARPIPVEDLFHHSTVRSQAEYLFGAATVDVRSRTAQRGRLLDRGQRSGTVPQQGSDQR